MTSESLHFSPGQTTYPWNTTQVWRGLRYTWGGAVPRSAGYELHPAPDVGALSLTALPC
jgi:hypothetical protein